MTGVRNVLIAALPLIVIVVAAASSRVTALQLMLMGAKLPVEVTIGARIDRTTINTTTTKQTEAAVHSHR